MNLIVDVGNTSIKLAVFEDRKLIGRIDCDHQNFLKCLDEISKNFKKIEHTMVSSVGNFEEKYLSVLKKRYCLHVLSDRTKLPFKNCYETPNTLGADRIALISASSFMYKNKNVLVIDAGTCVTYDIKNSKNEYLGGAISPGLYMRYKALNVFTEGLPLLDRNERIMDVGNTTDASIHLGVVTGLINEIDGFIDYYSKKYDDLTVILTGGDSNFLLDRLKNDIFANSNFLLEGLNYILEKNID
jgi:type III pantothenate kinase